MWVLHVPLPAAEVTQDVKKAQPPVNPAPAVNKTESAPAPKVNCTWEEMSAFKEQLLLYYCQKFVEPNCKLEVKTGNLTLLRHLLNKGYI